MLDRLKTCTICLVLLMFSVMLPACGTPPEQSEKPAPVVVSGKITLPGQLMKSETVSPDSQTGSPQTNIDKSKEEIPASSTDGSSEEEVSKMKPETAQIPLYNSEGKIDPFRPLIQTQKKEAQRSGKGPGSQPPVDEGPKRILTPLEKLDLSQIRLVAIVRTQTGSMAMVEETSGKGYVVKVGTYIGTNSGRIVEIKKDRLIVKESVKDFKGEFVDRFQEMKLHKIDDEG